MRAVYSFLTIVFGLSFAVAILDSVGNAVLLAPKLVNIGWQIGVAMATGLVGLVLG